MDNEIIIDGESLELPEEDDALSLSEEYETATREGRADDAASMQAAVCLLLAVGFFLTNLKFPDTAAYLLERFRSLALSGSIMPNPIDLVTEWLQELLG